MTDLSKWNFATDFTGIESASLIAGIDPAQYEQDPEAITPVLRRIERGYDFACQHYKSIHVDGTNADPEAKLPDDALASIKMREMAECALDHAKKVEFGNWLVTERSDFERQTFTREQLADWLKAIGLPSVYPLGRSERIVESNKLDNTLSNKELSTLLKLLIGMAIRGYSYDPNASRSTVPKEIADDLAVLGMSITDDTVRRYLKQAAGSVLPANWHQP